jgi:hypothetical protein
MAEPPVPGEPRDEPLGLAGFLEEDVEWNQLMSRVHRSIARRELSGQAVELGAHGLTGVVLEYLKAFFELFGGTGGGRRGD